MIVTLRRKLFDASFRVFMFCFEDLFKSRLERAVAETVTERVSVGVAAGVVEASRKAGLMCCFRCAARWGLRKDRGEYACQTHYTDLLMLHQEQDRAAAKEAALKEKAA